MATPYLNPQLGLKPLRLNEPYRADSEFDSTVRIPIPRARSLAAPAPMLGAASIGTPTVSPPDTRTLPGTPQVQPSVPAATTPGTTTPTTPSYLGPSLPQSYDPTQLNFEGTSGQEFLGGIPTTTTVAANNSNEPEIARLLGEFESIFGFVMPKDWRTILAQDPNDFLRQAKAIVDQGKAGGLPLEGAHADTKARQRLDDWYAKLEQAVGATTAQQANPDYKIAYLGQAGFNQAIQQLKLADASTSRSDEEQLMALLQSRGLMGTGAAAQALLDFREERMRNFYTAAQAFSQALLQGQISQVSARDLATLQADLQKRNAESLAAIQHKYNLEEIKAGQPNPLTQLFATAGGVAASALLAPKAPRTGGGSGATAAPYDPKLGYRS